MSAAQFTPGTWEPRSRLAFGESEFAVETMDINANDGKVVALTYGPDAKANARLIAAAPDLYEAARLFVEYDAGEQDDHVALMLAYAAALEAAKAALTRAQGQ